MRVTVSEGRKRKEAKDREERERERERERSKKRVRVAMIEGSTELKSNMENLIVISVLYLAL